MTNTRVLEARPTYRGNYFGTEALIQEINTGLIQSVFTPELFHHRNRSKYLPHQGTQEKARRVRQMEALNA